ncbi:long-chain fatty acid--CoA ligase [Rhizobium sp. Leaf371]|uniref:long-chain-fatty-acid--CoA ligase n=1 Tax=Rhizobium sp. Leaf371 TaxID=1736355 RepID=UPI000713135B|nr:long-chain-fatty-acid--CoA ligase [Rhizobium sp. Leaf371]KQS61236.1 long-chain fatty acid--CoA ligase [Rhizobium sp. Leaf371]
MSKHRILETRSDSAYHYPLLIRKLLANVAQQSSQEIVSAGQRFTYADLVERIHRLASLLAGHGVEAGDTVAVMDWDSHRYLEAYFAIPMMGAVLQTVNVRLVPDVIGFTLRQSQAKVILYHDDFAPVVERLRGGLADLRHVIRLSDTPEPGTYEDLIAAASPDFVFEDFDENAIATTFHTTGTTGDPKQVFFSHRQMVLHALAAAVTFAGNPDGQSLRRSDVYMPMTPMFHVHAWGLPYVATMLGLKQVYPGRYQAETILSLKKTEGITFSHGVPTLLRMIVDAAKVSGENLAPWTMLVGGSALSESLAEEALALGIDAFVGYGMSETGPILTVSRSKPGDPTATRLRAGLPIPLVETRLEPDGRGELLARAPWLTQGYGTQAASDDLWAGGWLHTQDIAEIDADGGVRIVDRLKDVIKTGGEWVSSIEIENILTTHPAVTEAAVIGTPSATWGERPLAFVIAAQVVPPPTENQLKAFLAEQVAAGRISRYAMPDSIHFLAALPRTSVGKIDKKALRREIQNFPGLNALGG